MNDFNFRISPTHQDLLLNVAHQDVMQLWAICHSFVDGFLWLLLSFYIFSISFISKTSIVRPPFMTWSIAQKGIGIAISDMQNRDDDVREW